MTTKQETLQDQVIAWRRHLHETAELSYEEHATSEFIYNTLQEFPGLTVTKLTETSVYAVLQGTKKTDQESLVVAFRADIDALPILEEADVNFQSKTPGVMHACGHDAHAAMLLGTAKTLADKRDEFSGEVRFIFQHAEEVAPGGAAELVAKGVMEGVDYVYALHVTPEEGAGKFTIKTGVWNAAGDDFTIKVNGRGGHASTPELATDPLVIGAEIVTNLQQIVSRKLPILRAPVITVTKFTCGNSYNVIAEQAELWGTIRSIDSEVRVQAREHLEKVVKGIAEAHDATAEVTWDIGCAAVYNDEAATDIARKAAQEVVGAENVIEVKEPIFGAEDFSAYTEVVPGSMQMIGVHNDHFGEARPLHHPKFKIDESALQLGVNYFVKIAENILK